MIVTIGAFDGFHAGHRYLLEVAQRLACQNKTGWAVVTFTPHPNVYFNKKAKLLLSEYEKSAEAKFLKIPKILSLQFDKIYSIQPEDFLVMLREEFSISGIVVGNDFRFGHNAGGDGSTIRDFCLENSFPYSIVEVIKYSDGAEIGKKISTTILREWFRNGKTEVLRDALKFPCPISGIVIHGERRGTKIGFPTINISTPTEKMLPAEGVYAVSVLTDIGWKAGALFIGAPPMFKDVKETRVEVHISDFSGDLYGRRVTVFLEEFIRQPQIFDDEAGLARDIKICVERAAQVFNVNNNLNNSLYNELRNSFI